MSQKDRLYAAIEHGDEEHRRWLKEAMDSFYSAEVNCMRIRIKKLSDEAVTPRLGSLGAAAVDLTSTSVDYDHRLGVITYGTGLAIEIPEGHVGLLFPRSSVYKTGLVMSNGVGVIDSDYRGEIMAKFYLRGVDVQPPKVGERVAQLMIIPIPAVAFELADELTTTDRGTNGHGSTGK